MPTPFWFADENTSAEVSLWDQVVLNGVVLPGLASIKFSAGAGRKRDSRSGAGRDGWRTREKGPTPVEFAVALRLWEAQHWADWERYSTTLTRRVREAHQRTALTIAHPVLAPLGVLRAFVNEVGGAEQEQVGLWRVEIKMMEYRQPTSASASRTVSPPWAVTPPATPTDQRPDPAFLGFNSAAPGPPAPPTPFSPADLERRLPPSRLRDMDPP